MRFSAVITAAGMSTRMKEFKQLLKIGESTFAERVIAAFQRAGIENIIVVTGHRADELEKALQKTGVNFIRNENYKDSDMFASAVLGLTAAKNLYDSVFVCPVDVPLFSEITVREMMKSASEGDVIIPTFCGHRGHPVLLNENAVRFALHYKGNGGLRGVFEEIKISGSGSICLVEVSERGICFDADTPDDYRKCLELAE